MGEPGWHERLERARKLYTTPHAVEILLGLCDGEQPFTTLPPGTDLEEINDAVRLLTCLDLIHARERCPPGQYPHISVTPRGQQLGGLLKDSDDEDRMLLTTPYATEILFRLRDGKGPTEAVPAGTDPQEVASAIQLLERLDLMR